MLRAAYSVSRGPARQHGQSMVLGLLLAGAAALAMVRYFGVGQVLGARADQTHALDAAAYSGALVQARALNLLSFINRAQVGHQVAMAHLATLGSWALFGGHEARQLGQGNPPAYLIAMMFGPSHGAAYASASMAAGRETTAAGFGALAQAYAAHDRLVHDTLFKAQQDIVTNLRRSRDEAMTQVLNRSYPDGNYALDVSDDGLDDYLTLQGGLSLSGFVTDVVARFAFLAPRNETARNAWMFNPRCPHLRHELRRRGETRLASDGRWAVTDTQSYHALRSNKWIGCYYREYAMGWGWIAGQQATGHDMPHVQNPPDNFAAQDFWRWVQTHTDWDIFSGAANPLANSRAAAQRPLWSMRGLPGYFDVRQAGQSKPLYFSARLVRAIASGERMHTYSAAETYFQRPQARADRRLERQNLFNPYWQARLAISPALRHNTQVGS
ncbi:hypothetical protein [Pusillimonas minor]